MAINAETTAAAQTGATGGMHLSADFPPVPTGSDPKSAAIAAELNAFVTAIRADIQTYNDSVDQLREGTVAAPKRIDAGDDQGAAIIENSGGTYSI